ncbi:MAG: VRR-NUC domain-containing protein [Ruminococcus sp.]|nr:VRR-NUC domain-containing protein [Ruminococcus sp.]
MNGKVPEHAEQAALFCWTDFATHDRRITQVVVFGEKMSVLDFLHAIPNGGYRNKTTAAKLKAEGVKPGVPDICLPYPVGEFHGLYIEMKRESGGRLSDRQKIWIAYLQSQNYAACVCNGFEEARDVLLAYLSGRFKNINLKSNAKKP